MAERWRTHSKMSRKILQTTLTQFKKILKEKKVPIKTLILFGSHAKGFAKKYSDVDVCVVCKDNSEIDVKELQCELNGEAGRNGLNMDIIVTTWSNYLRNKVSPILHEIRETGKTVANFKN